MARHRLWPWVAASMLGLPSAPAAAAPSCSTAALAGLGVADVTIASATAVPASASVPAYCAVEGAVATRGEGAGPGSAAFLLKLPVEWNRRLVFFGCGGNCGSVKAVAANAADVRAALGAGYAVVATDAGHEQDPATPDPTWILLAPGVPNQPAIVDFFYRAVHEVAVAAKALSAGYYAGPLAHAYFDGCSTGGRQALMEGERYPQDFDGLIAGDPIMALDDQRAATIKQAEAFLPPARYIPFSRIPALDAAALANCDAVDGVKDGLIQNPAVCSLDPARLVPGTLSAAQAAGLALYLDRLTDETGRPVAPGMAIGDYAQSGFEHQAEIATPAADPGAAQPWGGIGRGPNAWTLGDSGIRYYVERNPDYDVTHDWPQRGSVIAAAAVALLRARTGAGDADDPQRLLGYLEAGGKLILYHGFSDAMTSPWRTVWLYKALAAEVPGYGRLRRMARLFMVPGMGHCSGGSGPNEFATLGALDAWVSRGTPLASLVATNAESGRTMPLCPFPSEARYGGGPVGRAASWSCPADDRRLLAIGPDGRRAGAGDDDAPGRRE